MAELGNALAVVLAVNIMLWLGQVAVLELNPSGPVTEFYSCNGSMMKPFEQNECASGPYALDDSDPAGQLPGQGGEITIDSGNVFTDTFGAVINWLTSLPGVNYLYSILAAPSNFLKALHVPSDFSFALGMLWYGYTLFLIVAFALGRDY